MESASRPLGLPILLIAAPYGAASGKQRLAYQGNVAIKALEMLGRDLGMFAQRQPRDEDNPQMLRVLIDKPPDQQESNGLPEPQENARASCPRNCGCRSRVRQRRR